MLERAFVQRKGCSGPEPVEAGETVEVEDSVIPGPHMVPVDAAAEKKAKEIGLKIASVTPAPYTPESFGASPQNVVEMDPKWDKPVMTARKFAENCVNLCQSPANLHGPMFGCLLGTGVKTATRNMTGEPTRCKVLMDGEYCEALARLHPQLRNTESAA
jgi:hypothetical protein